MAKQDAIVAKVLLFHNSSLCLSAIAFTITRFFQLETAIKPNLLPYIRKAAAVCDLPEGLLITQRNPR